MTGKKYEVFIERWETIEVEAESEDQAFEIASLGGGIQIDMQTVNVEVTEVEAPVEG